MRGTSDTSVPAASKDALRMIDSRWFQMRLTARIIKSNALNLTIDDVGGAVNHRPTVILVTKNILIIRCGKTSF